VLSRSEKSLVFVVFIGLSLIEETTLYYIVNYFFVSNLVIDAVKTPKLSARKNIFSLDKVSTRCIWLGMSQFKDRPRISWTVPWGVTRSFSMEEKMEEKPAEQQLPERPLECCGECRRPIQVIYTEIIGKNVSRFAMCGECPVLDQKLHGRGAVAQTVGEASASLVCGGCGLTLGEIKMGSPLGCPLCYEIFGDEVVHELMQLEKIPPKASRLKKGEMIHVGRTPGRQQEIDPSLKLLSLQQALHETLGREDYEQAALLRDQIREIEEKTKGLKEKKNDGESS
jgi:protein arginine kinase activator